MLEQSLLADQKYGRFKSRWLRTADVVFRVWLLTAGKHFAFIYKWVALLHNKYVESLGNVYYSI